MMRSLWPMGRSLLFKLPPERAHGLAIAALKSGFLGSGQVEHRCLRIHIAGLDFPNPLGLAAGFDKNAEVADHVLRLGFGFSEIGTVTPRPQAGNETPRLFRLEEDGALINRMGFNNEGHEAVYQRLKQRQRNGIIGVNIGANKDCADRIGDYSLGIHRFYDVADYFTVNVSSPNTPGLRDLQLRAALTDLLRAVCDARDIKIARSKQLVPIFLKIAPDLTEESLDDIAEALHISSIDGVIISNTTLSREGLVSKEKHQIGGLSGTPLFERSTIVLAKMRQRVGAIMPIIGVGGVQDANSALEKIRAGADLVQLYSGMVFGGACTAKSILEELIAICLKDGVDTITSYRDQHLTRWAQQPL